MQKHRMIRHWLAGGLIVATASLPSASQARFIPGDPVSPPVSASGLSVQPSGTSVQSGFQWGDAGVGAAGTIVLLGAGAAASGVVHRRRARRAIAG